MAEFNVENGEVTLKFKVSDLELVYDKDIEALANVIAHVTERKPKNWSLKAYKYLKEMGLHRYNVSPADWPSYVVYGLDKESALRQTRHHLKGRRITEDLKWLKAEN